MKLFSRLSEILGHRRDNEESLEPVPYIPKLRYASGRAQWKGTRKELNDVLFLSELSKSNAPRGILMVLADGFGTGPNGRLAADMAIRSIQMSFEADAPHTDMSFGLMKMVGEAHRKVLAANQARAAEGSPAIGATIGAAIVRNGRAAFVTVGDVRLILFREHRILVLNRENLRASETEAMSVLSGEGGGYSRTDLRTVTAHLGQNGLCGMDVLQHPFRLLEGDRLVLMSSAIYMAMHEDQLIAALSCADPQEAADRVISMVHDIGLNDQGNTSVLILEAR